MNSQNVHLLIHLCVCVSLSLSLAHFLSSGWVLFLFVCVRWREQRIYSFTCSKRYVDLSTTETTTVNQPLEYTHRVSFIFASLACLNVSLDPIPQNIYNFPYIEIKTMFASSCTHTNNMHGCVTFPLFILIWDLNTNQRQY